jgi:hypothetical protein
MDGLIFGIKFILGITLVWVGVMLGINTIQYSYENLNCKLYKNNKLLLEKRSACMSTKSVGNLSQINTSQGFLCMFPEKVFVGDEYKVVCE